MPNYNLFTVSHKLTFDFGKLKRGSNKIIRESLAKVAEKSVKTSKENIDRGLRPPLKKFTKIMRKKGYGWSGEKVGKPKFGDKPLKQTGTLYNSIRYNKSKKAMDIKAYGLIQNKGFISQKRQRKKSYKNITGSGKALDFSFKQKFIKVPARPFISLPSKQTSGRTFGTSRKMPIGREIRKIHFMKMHNALKKRKR